MRNREQRAFKAHSAACCTLPQLEQLEFPSGRQCSVLRIYFSSQQYFRPAYEIGRSSSSHPKYPRTATSCSSKEIPLTFCASECSYRQSPDVSSLSFETDLATVTTSLFLLRVRTAPKGIGFLPAFEPWFVYGRSGPFPDGRVAEG